MILVDTSVWVDHLRRHDAALAELLEQGLVLGHPFILGELALGTLKARAAVLDALADLPQAVVATDDEVLRFIDAQALFGRGVGHVDVHLLAATRLTGGARLWTRDRRLATLADQLDIGANPPA